ncbi:hypothetical protein JB92DRAFT_3114515 [Gautieria morchelliformis]|nr:hypothetical protein JB92DRAFT_3114515 [Gautieria morchelliformis]
MAAGVRSTKAPQRGMRGHVCRPHTAGEGSTRARVGARWGEEALPVLPVLPAHAGLAAPAVRHAAAPPTQMATPLTSPALTHTPKAKATLVLHRCSASLGLLAVQDGSTSTATLVSSSMDSSASTHLSTLAADNTHTHMHTHTHMVRHAAVPPTQMATPPTSPALTHTPKAKATLVLHRRSASLGLLAVQDRLTSTATLVSSSTDSSASTHLSTLAADDTHTHMHTHTHTKSPDPVPVDPAPAPKQPRPHAHSPPDTLLLPPRGHALHDALPAVPPSPPPFARYPTPHPHPHPHNGDGNAHPRPRACPHRRARDDCGARAKEGPDPACGERVAWAGHGRRRRQAPDMQGVMSRLRELQ